MDNDGLDKYSEENSWDKRGWDKSFAVWGKRRWDNFPTWGKRRDDTDDLIIAQDLPEKKWSKFVSWGKRDAGDSQEKREQEMLQEPLVVDEQKWQGSVDSSSDANIKSVVKRSYPHPYSWWLSQYNGDGDKRDWRGFTTWGKRAPDFMETADLDKRKWAKFTSWGKRDLDDGDDASDVDKKWSKFVSWGKRSDDDMYMDAEKRKWAKFTSWGKRGDEFDDNMPEENADKRKWTRLSVWGKRQDDENVTDGVDKRNWAKFASWGKRPGYAPWLALNAWGKRRWSGLRTWGKRSADNTKAELIARKLLQMFDTNGDGALDFDELNTYINILMSLPSRTMKEPETFTEEEEN